MREVPGSIPGAAPVVCVLVVAMALFDLVSWAPQSAAINAAQARTAYRQVAMRVVRSVVWVGVVATRVMVPRSPTRVLPCHAPALSPSTVGPQSLKVWRVLCVQQALGWSHKTHDDVNEDDG